MIATSQIIHIPLLSAAAIALIAMATSASAQPANPADLSELDDDRRDISYENIPIDELDDMNIVRDGVIIGEVEEVLGNENDEVMALVMETEGNIPDIGEREVIVPIEALRFTEGSNEAVIEMTDEELGQLALWDD